MKIVIYTINDCPFCKQEKEYLTANKLAFEEKNLEINKDFLTEMLAVSNNFAGTPVTKIEKDDGKIEVLKGFTEGEFDQALGFKPAAVAETVPPTPVSTQATEATVTVPPVPAKPIPTVTEVPIAAPSEASEVKLDSILSDLQKAQAPAATETPSPAPIAAEPTTPVVPVAAAPVIPDLPASAASPTSATPGETSTT